MERILYNHVFSRHIFEDCPDVVIDMPVGLGHYPVDDQKANALLLKAREIAEKICFKVEITFWAKHDDGTEFKIAG